MNYFERILEEYVRFLELVFVTLDEFYSLRINLARVNRLIKRYSSNYKINSN